ncbi:MAG: Biopolymer transport protein ExbB [Syntrophorhabdus sp. PtaU1.Bin002]|nr:MAG: Biopolymer transport protein ExbB [Syntrophorhabdus sp. PtaB.Bin006]OPY69191.1 MAG: Biopolymer transport protein ExbB [Syntrophorhabdus sp. PtaU1.Bin002]
MHNKDMSNLNGYTGGILGLLSSAGPVAKVVVLILVVFSIVSWTIIFLKLRQFSKTEKEGEGFIRAVKDTDSFKKLISTYRESPDNAFYRLILTSYKEISSRQKENPGLKPETVGVVENTLRIVVSEESEKLERRLSFLATTANTAPFIGLFGTVWGIMDSFREIGVRGTTSLAVVAPGISEALIATALGLATAIPAVLAYNYFLGRLKRINSKMDNASMYVLNILDK